MLFGRRGGGGEAVEKVGIVKVLYMECIYTNILACGMYDGVARRSDPTREEIEQLRALVGFQLLWIHVRLAGSIAGGSRSNPCPMKQRGGALYRRVQSNDPIVVQFRGANGG